MCAHVKATWFFSSWLAQHACLELCNMHVEFMLTCFFLQHAISIDVDMRLVATCMSWILQHVISIHVDMLVFATCMSWIMQHAILLDVDMLFSQHAIWIDVDMHFCTTWMFELCNMQLYLMLTCTCDFNACQHAVLFEHACWLQSTWTLFPDAKGAR